MFCLFTRLSHWLMLTLLAHTAIAYPTTTTHLNERANAGDFFLRILPLGGSITAGWGSSTGNGYRKPVRDQLRRDGWQVNMVGTKAGSTNAPVTGIAMKDNNIEAVPGYEVAQIQGLLQGSLQYLPNIVLVNAGVNDCTYNDDIANIGSRMSSLLDNVFNNIADTTVILSTLIPSLNASVASCHDNVNSQYRNLVTTRSNQGQKIVLAEMAPSVSYWNEVVGGDYFDDTHPNDSGHSKMAAIWYKAVQEANSKNFFAAPAKTAVVNDNSPDSDGDDSDTFTSASLPAAP